MFPAVFTAIRVMEVVFTLKPMRSSVPQIILVYNATPVVDNSVLAFPLGNCRGRFRFAPLSKKVDTSTNKIGPVCHPDALLGPVCLLLGPVCPLFGPVCRQFFFLIR